MRQNEAERLFRKKEKAKYKQEVDTNVFLIKMEGLKDKKELATGDPVFCSKCQAIFNKHSIIKEEVKDEQVWNCEFCLAKNPI
jgi:Sec23/Sec24 zinc finger